MKAKKERRNVSMINRERERESFRFKIRARKKKRTVVGFSWFILRLK